MLIASIVGLDTRSTMDLDTTLRDLPLTEQSVCAAMESICKEPVEDDTSFSIISVEPIRKDDPYGGYRIRMNAVYETMITPLSIDVSTGDIITPGAVQYDFYGIFDDGLHMTLWGYNIETVLAEKTETILSRSVFNTRPRDYYDVYILGKTQKIDRGLFEDALAATARHRGSAEMIKDRAGILERISLSGELRNMWEKYRKQFPYARETIFEEILDMLRELLL